MKLIRIVYEPKAIIEFTEAEVMELRRLSESHYDGTVKALVPPGRGAIINGLVNSTEDGKAESSPLTNREVQLLIKACEMARDATGAELYWVLWRQVLQPLEEAFGKANGASK